MKKIICLLMTVALLAVATSCSKEEIITITGQYRYDGNLESVLDNKDFYDFTITESTMKVISMWKEDAGTFNYTRSANKIKINPALGGTVSNATIIETSGGFGLKLDEDRVLFFTRR